MCISELLKKTKTMKKAENLYSNYLVPFSLPPLTHLSKTVIAVCMQHTPLNNRSLIFVHVFSGEYDCTPMYT